MIDPARLAGTWRLRSWTSIGNDGSVTEPMGPAPEGLLVYTASGTMITTIGAPARPPITGGDILRGPPVEIVAMATTFIAYSGTYRLDGDDVIHGVEMSLFPDWVGTHQRRHVTLSDDGSRLTLTADPMTLGGRTGAQRLGWERIGD